MKKLISSIFLVSCLFLGMGFVNSAQAKISSVRGYIKPSSGRYVMPHYKTAPNKTRLHNFSTKGNYNPFTGKKGDVNPWK